MKGEANPQGAAMDNRESRGRAKTKREKGTVLVFVTIALLGVMGMVGWSTETGRAWQAKNQLQAAADSSALAGVGNLFTPSFAAVDEAAARTAAITYGALHEVAELSNLTIAAADVEVGSWNMAAQTFTALPGNTNVDVVRAVRVVTRRDSSLNGKIPTIFGRILGHPSISVNTDAVAEWGFAGSGGPGIADLPIVIDCCAVAGSDCNDSYCDTVSNTISNPCWLADGVTTTSCLEFFSTPKQNACWSVFDGDHSSVSVPGMTEIVANGNSGDIGSEPVYLDNGTKTPVIQDIKDKFDSEGTDTSVPPDGINDSWVVTLPVVECQNPGDQCASGDTQHIVGFLCMDIREIIVTSDGTSGKII
jgi:hypothetical protein